MFIKGASGSCSSNPCSRGYCTLTATSHVCVCPPGTRGNKCEIGKKN